MKEKRLLKKFEIVEKESSNGNRYKKLIVHSMGDSTCELFLTDSQVGVVEIIGKENCYVDIQTRMSKENKPYNVISLVCGEDVFDFFPKDRAFITLAKLQAQKSDK